MKRAAGKGGRGVPDFNRFKSLSLCMCLLRCPCQTKLRFFVRFFMAGYLRRLGIGKVPMTVPVAYVMPGFYQPVQAFFLKDLGCRMRGNRF